MPKGKTKSKSSDWDNMIDKQLIRMDEGEEDDDVIDEEAMDTEWNDNE